MSSGDFSVFHIGFSNISPYFKTPHMFKMVWINKLSFPVKTYTFIHLTCWKQTELAEMAQTCVIAWLCDCVIGWLWACVIVCPGDFFCVHHWTSLQKCIRHLTCWKWTELEKAHACVIVRLPDCEIAWLCDFVTRWFFCLHQWTSLLKYIVWDTSHVENGLS